MKWLAAVQWPAPAGHLIPIGSRGFYPKAGERARFDQQPVEAGATVSACLQALRTTGNPAWRERARSAFNWFLGGNDLHAALYDDSTGGCRDGLHPDRVNENQGAESTLSFLIALADLELLEQTEQQQLRFADAQQFRSLGVQRTVCEVTR